MDEENLIEERKEKIFDFFKKSQVWVILILIIALILGAYIRSLPMQDHGGKPGLWDITTNTWTLGPDLDPWLFERYAKIIIEEGKLPEVDMMRNVPLGFKTSAEVPLLSYMISWTYYSVNIFGEYNIEFAADIFPVIMFLLTIISFFLFVREVFSRKSRKSILRANIIAIISTFFMIVIPVFLSRTIAGIPEKESAAFFFMFLAFYLFLKSWKSENLKIAIILGILAGISTALMGFVWGGVSYVFIPIAGASLIALILNKINKKEFVVYFLWVFFSFSFLILFSDRYSLIGMLTSLSSAPAFLVLFIMCVHFILWKTKLSNLKILNKIKIPKTITSFILSLILLLIIASIFIGPYFIVDKIKAIHQIIFKPVLGRWNITVAENRQPYYTEWSQSFGPFIKNIPILFWLFFIGSVVLFKKMLREIKQKDAWILTCFYVLFFFGLVFSRYAPHPYIMDGDGFISKFVYYASALILIGGFVYFYNKYYKENDKSFEKINFGFLLLFLLFILTLFTARGAVRLIMVLAPIAPIFVGFLIVESFERFRKTKDEILKTLLGIFFILILIASIFSFWTFYKGIKNEAYNFIPSYYNQQWQKAMQWVRDETPENSVFGHWWDYGYWVQSIGNRATVLDGGNAFAYWNYLMGRLVLTGDNQADALEFLYNHNTTHFLIDSSDIGKYGAFSSIGSDKNYDRYSWISTFLLDETKTQETNNYTLLVYTGGIALDEDLVINENGKEVWLPGQNTGVGAILLPVVKSEKGNEYMQPYTLMVYNNKQYKIDLRYLFVDDKLIDFKSGINATAYIFPELIQEGQGIRQDPIGSAMFISPRLMRGMLSQVYLMDDPLDNFPNFKLVHTQSNLMVESLRSQGMNLPEFVFFQGVQGPIKIWEIEYTGEEKIKQEYLDTDPTKYLDWAL